MKKSIYLILIMMAVFSITSIASPGNFTAPIVTVNTEEITISGNTNSLVPYESIMIEIFNPLCDLSTINEISKDEFLRNILYLSQVNTDKKGNYTFVINMKNRDMGEYKYRLTSENHTVIFEDTIIFASLEQKQEFIDELNNANDYIAIKELLSLTDKESTIAKMFNLRDDLIFKVHSDNLAKMFFNIIKNEPLDRDNLIDFNNKILSSALASALNEGKNFNILNYSNYLNLDTDYINSYTNKLSNKAKSEFTSYFYNQITSLNDVQDKFKELTALSIINNIQNWSDIKYVIENHGPDFGIDMQKYSKIKNKEKLSIKLAEKSPFGSITDFANKYNIEILTIDNDDDNKSNNSSGGGSGGISLSGSDISLKDIKTDEMSNAQKQFNDINEAKWAKGYIENLAKRNIISGDENNNFLPNNFVKREEFIKMLVLSLGFDSEGAESNFSDVYKEQWYYSYIATAQLNGIISGYEDGSFGVGKYLSREDLAVLVYRALKLKSINIDNEGTLPFADNNDISIYANEAVYSLKNAGILTGKGENLFVPKDNCTRAETAKVLSEIIDFINEK